MKAFLFEEDHPFAILVPLIEEGRLDPWKVDIVELANLYIEELRRRESLDLRIPARALVAASFLLRKKVEVLFPRPERKPSRKRDYTLHEIAEMFEEEENLIDNLEKARRILRRTSPRKKRKRSAKKRLPLHISRFEDAIKEIWELLGSMEVGRRIEFLTFLGEMDFVPRFIALMYLHYEGKIELHQKEPYGSIIVEVKNVGGRSDGS